MARARGYAPFESSPEQDHLLDQIIALAGTHGADGVGVFDLDGCLFDTRPRQMLIIREFAGMHDALDLYKVEPDHFKDWDLGNTMRHAGLAEERVQALAKPLADFWFSRFFRSDYVIHDHAMPGAVDLVRQCRQRGLKIVYLTGRDETKRSGTEASLSRFGFPLDGGDCQLMVKPDFHTDDTEFKNTALSRIAELGQAVLFLDNEPSNVNRFRDRHPKALVVFVETDHSPKPDEPHQAIPWLRSFSRS